MLLSPLNDRPLQGITCRQRLSVRPRRGPGRELMPVATVVPQAQSGQRLACLLGKEELDRVMRPEALPHQSGRYPLAGTT